MARFTTYIRLGLATLISVIRAIVRRLRHGPLVPGWSWTVELRRAALAGWVRTAFDHTDAATWASADMAAPIRRAERREVSVSPSRVGGVPGEWIRHLRHAPGRPVILYFHGGGYVMGHPAMERPFIARLAVAAGADAFSVDYRLAPQHPFPAALDDAFAAYMGVLARGATPIFVAGDSAGGGLATALLLRLRDEARPLPRGAVLFSPWVDLANSGSTLTSNAETDYLPQMAGRPALEYLGGVDPTHPLASPVYADLAGLPPLLVFAGGREMILEDSRRLVAGAVSAGSDAELHVEPDMYHVWPAILPEHEATRRTLDRAGEWMSRRTS